MAGSLPSPMRDDECKMRMNGKPEFDLPVFLW